MQQLEKNRLILLSNVKIQYLKSTSIRFYIIIISNIII